MDKKKILAKIEETKELMRHVDYDLYKTRHPFSKELLEKGMEELRRKLEKYQTELGADRP